MFDGLSASQKADIALLVAGASAMFTLGALIWEIVRHRLVGARVRVRMVLGIVTETGALIRNSPIRSKKPPARIEELVGNRPWIEVAVITVANYGRTAVSVSDIALDFGRQPWWKLGSRHTVSGFAVKIHGAVDDQSIYRIEAHDKVTIIYDLWTLVAGIERSRKTLKVRASAIPASRHSRRRRSPRRHRLKIAPGQQAIWPHGEDHPLLDVFRAVWRALAFSHPGDIYKAWIGVLGHLSDFENGEPPDYLAPDFARPSLQNIASELQPPLEDLQAMMEAAKIIMAMPKSKPRNLEARG